MEAGFTFFSRRIALETPGSVSAVESPANPEQTGTRGVVGKAVGRLMQRRLAVRPSFNLLKAWGCRELDSGVLSKWDVQCAKSMLVLHKVRLKGSGSGDGGDGDHKLNAVCSLL